MVSEPLMAPNSSPSDSPSTNSLVVLKLPISTKLNRSNFLVWKSQIVPALHGHDLYKYLDENPPSKTITIEGSQQVNPNYYHWHKQDQLLLSWIRSSLSESILGQVVSYTTTAGLWKYLQQSFSASSRARLSELRRLFQNTTKGGSSCADYCQKMRAIADELAFIGSSVSDEDLVLQVLGGLGADFNSFVVAANTKDNLSFSELQAMLLSHESLLQSQIGDLDVSGNAHIQEDGNQLQLSLEQAGGAEAVSRQTYLYGRFDMQIKAVAGYAAGTVTSFFLQSPRPTNDEIDFELLGNVTGEPYLLHTNLWTNGVGNREEQMNLWFDPSADFHTYTVIWNPQNIIWLVDETPVRVYRNMQGVQYLNQQHLNTHVAVWNGEQWATRQGRIGIDWSQAPFVAYYRNYHSESRGEWYSWRVDEAKLRSVRQKYMVYDYCKDTAKYPQGFPPECSTNEHV